MRHSNQQGQILMLGIVIMAILFTMSTSLWGYTHLQVKASRQAVERSQALQLAEAGIDKAISELNLNSNFTGESSSALGVGEFSTSVATIDPNTKRVTSTGYIPNSSSPKAQVTVKMNVSIDLSSVAFNFGVQVGAGGLDMDNNSSIIGNVFSNGNITGGNATVTGDAVVAGGGSPTADKQCTVNDSDFDFNLSDRRDVAQKFTPTVSGPLTKISVYLRKVGSPSDITVRITTNGANQPTKTTVGGSGTISGSAVTGSYGWIDGSFSSSPMLTAGTAYWLVLDTSTTSSNYYTWASQSGISCAGGEGRYSSNWNNSPSPTWTGANRDFNFKTFMGGVDTYLEDVRVNGTARAHSLLTCNIGGDAYFATTNTCTTTGTSFSGSADTAPQALPVSQSQIDEWKSTAASGGTLSGTQTITGTQTLGPVKIAGDLVLSIGSTLYMTGPIWVEGNITMNNNTALRVDNAVGNASTVILADDPANQTTKGFISISNNAIVTGNGQPNSYVMVLTTKSGAAMDVANNASGAIYYAGNGSIDVANNAGGNQITGYAIHLNENASVTYSTGLQSVTFANGPGGSWAKVRGSYLILP